MCGYNLVNAQYFLYISVEIELLSLPCDAADSSVSRMGCDSSILFLYVFTCTLHARSPSDKQLSFGKTPSAL